MQLTPSGKAFDRRLIGRTITAVDRLGKRVVVRLDDTAALVFEPRMTGLVLLADPPTREHLRLRFSLESPDDRDACELLYWDRRGLGLAAVLRPAELDQRMPGRGWAPMLLALHQMRCRRLGDSRRAVKVALLDQRAVAGIGNLYASEIFHWPVIHPARRCDLSRATSGSGSLRQSRKCSRRPSATRARRCRMAPTATPSTNKGDIKITTASTTVRRNLARGVATQLGIVQAQRSTFFCPTCQPRRKRVATPRRSR